MAHTVEDKIGKLIKEITSTNFYAKRRAIFKLINDDRVEHGLYPLTRQDIKEMTIRNMSKKLLELAKNNNISKGV